MCVCVFVLGGWRGKSFAVTAAGTHARKEQVLVLPFEQLSTAAHVKKAA